MKIAYFNLLEVEKKALNEWIKEKESSNEKAQSELANHVK